MSPDDLRVRGGAGGTQARLEDLELVGRRLGAAGAVMSGVAVRAGRVAVDPALLAGAPLSPQTWVAAQSRLAVAVGGPSGAVLVATRLTGLGAGALAAADAYRSGDAGADAAIRAADRAAGAAVGQLVTDGVLFGLGTAPGALLGVEVAARYLAPRLDGDQVLDLVASHPGLLEHTLDATPALLGALVRGLPPLGLVTAGLTGRPTPPDDVPGGAGWLTLLGRKAGYLQETGVTVKAGKPTAVPSPRGLADVFRGIDRLDPAHGAPPGTVGVVSVTGADGRRAWIVEVPGTQSWSPRPGGTPLDLTGSLHGVAREPTAAGALVTQALARAGVPPDEPVMLVGHSEGGIIAAELAADPAFRRSYRVTHVVTAGAPIGRMPIPDSVTVISLEHDHDPVARLDGAPNPDRPHWVTVSRDVTPPAGPPGSSQGRAAASHDLVGYTRTAELVDDATDPGLAQCRDGLRPFFGPGSTATEVLVTGTRQLP